MKPIEEMTGLELREACAREVMGYRFDGCSVWCGDEMVHTGLNGAPSLLWLIEHRVLRAVPAYESSIEAAFQVVEKMREKGWILELLLSNAISNRATASFLGMMHDVPRAPRINAIGDTAPLAICRAALQAVRAK